MIPGIGGDLVSHAYLAGAFAHDFAGELGEATRRDGARRLVAIWRRAARTLGPASGPRAVLDVAILPVLSCLGYAVDRLEARGAAGFAGTLAADGAARVAFAAVPWDGPLDRNGPVLAAAGLAGGARWGLAANGRALRLIDAGRPWSARVLEFDLERVLASETACAVFWGLSRPAALVCDGSTATLLDRVADASASHGATVRRDLGAGVVEALGVLLQALDAPSRRRGSRVEPAAVLDQALTVVYRLLFLFFAEARSLVPTWHRVYREAYTLDALTRRLLRAADGAGTWATLQAMARLAYQGVSAGDLRVTAFNGRLFAPGHAPLATRPTVPDAAARRVVLALATGAAAGPRRRMPYRDLGVEQLGAVYERVLEYEAVRAGGHLSLRRTSNERKATGSFYTPRPMTEFLVRRTLAPLVAGRSAEEILRLRVVDPAMGSGAFLVAACRYLTDACVRANLADGTWLPPGPAPAERASVARAVAERCLYGVDRNPMAVQLARLSLWLTTLAADRPLSFLDHHLAAGDSLVGARLVDLQRHAMPSRGATTRSPRLPFPEDEAARALAAAVPERFRLALDPGDTPSLVRDKERRLAALDAPGSRLGRLKDVADLWVGMRLAHGPMSPAIAADLADRLLTGRGGLPAAAARELAAPHLDRARARGAFHWDLAFPEVFYAPDGRAVDAPGFDAVLGNPPWDVLRDPDTVRFVSRSGVYPTAGGGHPNSYQLFVERALQLVRAGGRLGLVLPSGLLADHASAALRRALLDRMAIDAVFCFDNRTAIFPIHRSVRFVLLTATAGGTTTMLRTSPGLADAGCLEAFADLPRDDPGAATPIVIDRALVERLDPDHLTVPDLRTPRDAAILAAIAAAHPRLADPAGWHVRFGRELNATDDRRHFVPLPSAARPAPLPVADGRHLEPFRANVAQITRGIEASVARRLLGADAPFTAPRLAYRDVASPTNRLTLIAAILPPGVVSVHTVFCLKQPLPRRAQDVLLALLNSLVANYLVRLYVSTHVTTALMARLPVPCPPRGSPAARTLAALALRLERDGIEGDTDAYARLNAVVAQLYGLTPDQYEHVVGTFPLLPEELRSLCLQQHQGLIATPS